MMLNDHSRKPSTLHSLKSFRCVLGSLTAGNVTLRHVPAKKSQRFPHEIFSTKAGNHNSFILNNRTTAPAPKCVMMKHTESMICDMKRFRQECVAIAESYNPVSIPLARTGRFPQLLPRNPSEPVFVPAVSSQAHPGKFRRGCAAHMKTSIRTRPNVVAKPNPFSGGAQLLPQKMSLLSQKQPACGRRKLRTRSTVCSEANLFHPRGQNVCMEAQRERTSCRNPHPPAQRPSFVRRRHDARETENKENDGGGVNSFNLTFGGAGQWKSQV